MSRMKDVRIEYFDNGPDELGKRHFLLLWNDPAGIFRPEIHPEDGKPVGYRRAQAFYCIPQLERFGLREEAL